MRTGGRRWLAGGMIGVLLLAQVVQAATYTVTPADNLAAAIGRLQPGDTLVLASGSYPVQLHSLLGTHFPSGTAAAPITIKAAAAGQAVINPRAEADTYSVIYLAHTAYLVFDGLVVDASGITGARGINTIKIDDTTHHITMQNTEVREAHVTCSGAFSPGGCGYTNAIEAAGVGHVFRGNNLHRHDAYGLYLSTQQALVEGNDIHDNQAYGIHLYASGHSDISGNILRNNRIHHNGYGQRNPVGSAGILLSSGSENVACNNTIEDQLGVGVQVYMSASNSTVQDNTIAKTAEACIDVNPGASGTVLRGNKCLETARVLIDNGRGTQMQDQAVTGAGAQATGTCGGSLPPVASPGPLLPLPAPRHFRYVQR